jgi:WD40 repeat protein
MSGLEFLFRKTLSNPSDLRPQSSPSSFSEGLQEFISFCEKQLPEMLELDFTPVSFDISENEEVAVLGSGYGDVVIYDLGTKKMLKDEEICHCAINALYLVMGDRKLVCSTADLNLIILDFPSLKRPKTVFMGPSLAVPPQPLCVKLGSGRNMLYCCNFSRSIRVLELDNRDSHKERVLDAGDEVSCIDVSDDGSLLACGLVNGIVKLIHCESESELQSTAAHASSPTIISFSEHRRHIGVGFKDNSLRVWLVDSDFSLRFEFSSHSASITGLAFVRDNRYMVSGSRDSKLIMWDMKVERSPYIVSLFEGEVSWFRCSANHRRLYFSQSANYFMVWEVPSLTKNARYSKHSGPVNSVAFLPNTFELVSVGSDGLAVIWDYRNDSMQEAVQLLGDLQHVIASRTGQFVIITANRPELESPCIYRWNLSTGMTEETGLSFEARSITFSSDENMVAVGDTMNRIVIYDTEVMQRKTTIKGHLGPVTEICFLDNNETVLSASMDKTLAKWDVATGTKLETFVGHNRPVLCMIVTPNGWVISGSEDRTIIVWDIGGMLLYTLVVPDTGKNLSLFLSSDGEYMISLMEDKFYYWKMDNMAVMFQCDTTFAAKQLAVSENERVLAVAEGNTIYVEENPLRSTAIRIVGKNSGSQHKFMKYILSCIKNNDKGKMEEEHNHWVVTPYLIGTSHILSYSNRMSELDDALFSEENPAGFFSTVKGETPISIATEFEYKNCIDICLKYMKHGFKRRNWRAYVPLGNCLTKLNTLDIPDIDKIYETLFQKANDAHLPAFCLYETPLPTLHYADSLVISPDQVVPKDFYSPNGRTIVFHRSLCPLNIDIGCTDSIEFLVSLTECSNDQIFRTTLLQVMLMDKWDRVKWAVFAQGSLYIFYMFQLSFYCVMFRDSPTNLILLFLTHVLLFLYEVSQIITDPIDYWFDMWNILDQLRGLSCTVYAIMRWEGYESDNVLLTVIIFSWIRGISYFRMFDGTRYFVRLLTEVIKDMKVFFVILFYSTFAFTFIFFLRTGDLSFSEYITVSYRLDLGDFTAEYTEIFDWVIFFLATTINPLIMLNLLISIMGDTYSKVKESNDIANFMELTEMIIEIEKLMFWKKDQNEKHYLHQCDFLTSNKESSEKIFDKIKALKMQLVSVESTIKYVKDRVSKSNVKELEESVSGIKKDQEEMTVAFQEALEVNNTALEELLSRME